MKFITLMVLESRRLIANPEITDNLINNTKLQLVAFPSHLLEPRFGINHYPMIWKRTDDKIQRFPRFDISAILILNITNLQV